MNNARDTAAGLMFLGFGVVGLVVARGYDVGTSARMGPGYFPHVLCAGLILFGIGILARGLTTVGQPMERIHPRPLLALLVSVMAFGLTLERFGLVVAVALVTGLMAFAMPKPRWREVVVSATLMSLFCTLVFVIGLKQQMKIWGW